MNAPCVDGCGSEPHSESARPLLQLEGAALRERLTVDRAAVDNWSRYATGPERLVEARLAMLEVIEREGELSVRPPSWMTSPKPGVELWLHLPSDVSLVIERDRRPGSRPLRAVNALAPRRGARRSTAARVTTVRPASAHAAADLLALRGSALAANVWIAFHCAERLRERAGAEGEIDVIFGALSLAIATSGRPLERAPGWANAAGSKDPVVLIDWEGQQVVLALKANDRADIDRPWVATTCIAERWVAEDLLTLTGPSLQAHVHVSSAVVRSWIELYGLTSRDEAITSIREQIERHGRASVVADGSLELTLGNDVALTLRPASDAQKAASDIRYVATGLVSRSAQSSHSPQLR